jgi:hypothetical protein
VRLEQLKLGAEKRALNCRFPEAAAGQLAQPDNSGLSLAKKYQSADRLVWTRLKTLAHATPAQS